MNMLQYMHVILIMLWCKTIGGRGLKCQGGFHKIGGEIFFLPEKPFYSSKVFSFRAYGPNFRGGVINFSNFGRVVMNFSEDF